MRKPESGPADPTSRNGDPGSDRGSALAEMASVDEILQVMFWTRGEGIAADAAARDLTMWIGLEEAAIAKLLVRMEELGLVTGSPDDGGDIRYKLTDRGGREGGRRFADEFADVTRSGHGECNDPQCDCHATGRPEDCAHHHAH